MKETLKDIAELSVWTLLMLCIVFVAVAVTHVLDAVIP